MKILYFIPLLFLQSFANAQTTYFQQDVKYSIDVTLDDDSHILRGFERMVYTNHSKDTLKFIFIHLYPNAYKNDQTVFTEQLVQQGKTAFYFSSENDKGSIDSLDFKVNEDAVLVSPYNNHDDVVLLELNQPLLPGGHISISTSFRVILPEIFSRIGHDDQNYQITQWFPKPAVYDATGWHPMHYVDQGEYYGEFGNFQVNITVPSDYIVATTGIIQDESEKKWIDQMASRSDSMQPSNLGNKMTVQSFKTLHVKQDQVHDFAWFASKDYLIEKTEVLLPNGKKVKCFAYYFPKNEKLYKGSSLIASKTISYFSEHLGTYPYEQVSIVDGKLLAGGGMEYPMITLIGALHSKSELQTAIIHEVGHNWFYGILANNERDHPWMDESLNSLYESQLDQKLQSEDAQKTLKIEKIINGSFSYLLSAKENTDQAISENSEAFTSLNYGGILYKKAPMLLAYLQSYLGETVFESCMKQYYETWKFKHPSPEDFRLIFEKESHKNLDWFFNQGIETTEKIDFKITRVEREPISIDVFAKSRTSFKGPIPVMAYKGNQHLETKWIEYPYQNPATFSNDLGATSFHIDREEIIPELKISNNDYFRKKLIKRNPLRLKIGTGIGIHRSQNVYLLPSVAYNQYDNFMLGIIVHNLSIPNNPFQFALAPMYAFGSKQPVGTGFISYSIFPHQSFQKITLSIQGNSFHHKSSRLNIKDALYLRHTKISPSLELRFKPSGALSPVRNRLILNYVYVSNDQFKYTIDPIDSLFRPSIGQAKITQVGRIQFDHENNRTFNPYQYQFKAEGNQEFIKLGLTLQSRIDYHMKNKSLYVRAFGGKFFDLKNTSDIFALRQRYLNTTFHWQSDYLYDETYIARNEQDGFLSQQVTMQEGGFKMRTIQYANPIGVNDNWLAAINLRSDIPVKLPLKLQLFADAATYADAKKINPSGKNMIFEAGLELHLFNDILVLYAPLLLSKDFKDYSKQIYPKNRILYNMSFALNLSQIKVKETQKVVKYLIQ